MMRCKRCRAQAVIDVRRHRAAFCAECFQHHCREQVRRTIESHRMIAPGERPLVAVSGGKDSLAIWDILLDLGYDADGVSLGLGITDYSDTSRGYAERYAEQRGVTLQVIDIPAEHGFGIPDAAKATKRVPCSACGLSKRHLLNKAALDGGYDVLVTGHNLDDEAAVLFGNVLQWHTDYLARQRPVLPATDGFARRVTRSVRHRAAVAPRLPRPATTGAAGTRRLRPPGQTAHPHQRARDSGLLRAEAHRLHRRGVPDGGRQPPPPLQGDPQRARGAHARRQGGVLPAVPRQDAAAARRRRRGGASAGRHLLAMRSAQHGRRLRLLQAGGARRPRVGLTIVADRFLP